MGEIPPSSSYFIHSFTLIPHAFLPFPSFSSLSRMVGGFAEIPIFVQRLPIFYKQRNYNF